MGDRICIRLTDGDRTSPLFYGHWCGISALKDMNDALRDENNGMMNIMCVSKATLPFLWMNIEIS